MMEEGDEKAFGEATRELRIPESAIDNVWKGFKKKELRDEGKKEAEELGEYVPTLEEFKEYIKKMNPYSTGGISGLIYFMIQKWDERVKDRIYGKLREKLINKEIPEGWGDCC